MKKSFHALALAIALALMIAFVLLLILFTLALSIVLKPRGHDMPQELSGVSANADHRRA